MSLPNKYSLPSNFLACQHTNKFPAYSTYFEEIHQMINDMCDSVGCEKPRWFKYNYKRKSSSLLATSFRIFYDDETTPFKVGDRLQGNKSGATIIVSAVGTEGGVKYIDGTSFTKFFLVGESLSGTYLHLVYNNETGDPSTGNTATGVTSDATLAIEEVNMTPLPKYVEGGNTTGTFVTGEPVNFSNGRQATVVTASLQIRGIATIVKIRGTGWSSSTYTDDELKNGAAIKTACYPSTGSEIVKYVSGVETKILMREEYIPFQGGYQLKALPCFDDFSNRAGFTLDQFMNHILDYEYITDGGGTIDTNIINTFYIVRNASGPVLKVGVTTPTSIQNLKNGLERVKNYSWDLLLTFASWSGLGYDVGTITDEFGGKYRIDTANALDVEDSRVFWWETTNGNDFFSENKAVKDYKVVMSQTGRFPPIYDLPTDFPVSVIVRYPNVVPYFVSDCILYDFYQTPAFGPGIRSNYPYSYAIDVNNPGVDPQHYYFPTQIYAYTGGGAPYAFDYNDDGRYIDFPLKTRTWYHLLPNIARGSMFPYDSVKDYQIYGSNNLKAADDPDHEDWILIESGTFADVNFCNRSEMISGSAPFPFSGLTAGLVLDISAGVGAHAFPSVGLYPNDWPHDPTVPPAYVDFLTNKTAIYPTNIDTINKVAHNFYYDKTLNKQYCYYKIAYSSFYNYFDIRQHLPYAFIYLPPAYTQSWYSYEKSCVLANGPDYPSCVVLPKICLKNGTVNTVSPLRYFQLLQRYSQSFLLTTQAKFILKNTLNTFIRDYLLNLDDKTASVFQNFDDLCDQSIAGSPITNFAAELITMFRENEWLLVKNSIVPNTAAFINIKAFVNGESIAPDQIVNYQFVDENGNTILQAVMGINLILDDDRGYKGIEILFADNKVRRFDKNLNILPVNGSTVFSRSPNANEFTFISTIQNIPSSYDNAVVGNNFSKNIYIAKGNTISEYKYDDYIVLDLYNWGKLFNVGAITDNTYQYVYDYYNWRYYNPFFHQVIEIEEDGLYEFACYNEDKNNFRSAYLVAQDNNKVFHGYGGFSDKGTIPQFINSSIYYPNSVITFPENGGFIRGGLRIFCLDSSVRYVEGNYYNIDNPLTGRDHVTFSGIGWSGYLNSGGNNNEGVGVPATPLNGFGGAINTSGVYTSPGTAYFIDRGPGIYYERGFHFANTLSQGLAFSGIYGLAYSWDSKDVLGTMSQKKETTSMSGANPVISDLTVDFFDTIAPIQVNLKAGKYLCAFLESDVAKSVTAGGNPYFVTGYNGIHGSSRKINTVYPVYNASVDPGLDTHTDWYGGTRQFHNAMNPNLKYRGYTPTRFYYRKIG